MNDHQIFDPLDERAIAAAADLLARAANRPIPDLEDGWGLVGPTVTPLRRQPVARRRILAVAAAVAVLAAGATWASLGDDDEDREADIANTGAGARPFVATDVPEGLRLAGAVDLDALPPTDEPDLFGPMAIYGDADGVAGLAGVVWRSFEPDEVGAVEVDVPRGRGYEVPDLGIGAAHLVVVQDGTALLLLSPTLDSSGLAELVGIPEGITVAGDDPDLTVAASFHGLDHLGDMVDAEASLLPFATLQLSSGSADLEGKAVAYTDGPDRMAVLTSAARGDAGLAGFQVVGAEVRSTTVRGNTGVVVTYPTVPDVPASPFRLVAWIEDGGDGEVVRLAGAGLSEDELLAMADGSEPATGDEWRDLLRRTRLGELDTGAPVGGPDQEVTRGELADGTSWVLRVTEVDGGALPSLDVDVAGAGSEASSSTVADVGGDEPALGVVVTSAGDRRFAAGFVSDEVATVELRDGAGQVLARSAPLEGVGYRAWVAEYVDRLVVVLLDDAGAELGRADVSGGTVQLDG